MASRRRSAKIYAAESLEPDADASTVGPPGTERGRRQSVVSLLDQAVGDEPPDFDSIGSKTDEDGTPRTAWTEDEAEAKAGQIQGGRMIIEKSAHNQEEYTLGHVIKAGDNPYAYEGLEDGDDDLPWAPPAVGKAKLWRKVMTFAKGRGSVRYTGPVELSNLGPSNANYFELTKWMAFGFLAMTIVSVPFFSVAWEGNGVLRMDDPKTARLSLANAGIRPFINYNASLLIFPVNETGAIPEQEPTRTEISLFDQLTFSPRTMAELLSYQDILTTFVFLVFVLIFRIRSRTINQRSADITVAASSYSIMVRRLPPDATDGEVRRHFSDLFQLADPDWEYPGWCGLFCAKKSRLPQDMEDSGDVPGDKDVIEQADPIDPCRPVTDVSNTQNDEYLGSWVAEVSMVFRNSRAVRAYLQREALYNRLKAVRAVAKKYSADTPLKSGPDERKKLAALSRVEKYEKRLTYLRSLQGGTSTECIGAYVTFNNEESALRAKRDYAGSHGCCNRLWQPTPLRFRGTHALSVSAAPEAGEILWENLETSGCARLFRTITAWFVLLVVLCGCFLLTYTTLRIRGVLGEPDVIPSAAVCESHIPASVYLQYLTLGDPQIIRGDPGQFRCEDPDSHFLYFDVPNVRFHVHPSSSLLEAGVAPNVASLPTNISTRVIQLEDSRNENLIEENLILIETNETVFNLTREGIFPSPLPVPTDSCIGPCIPTNPALYAVPDATLELDPTATTCKPLSCSVRGWEKLGHFCNPTGYPPGLMATCYCQQELQHLIEASGLISAGWTLRSGKDGDMCSSYVALFFWNKSLPYIGMMALVILNSIITTIIQKLSVFQRYLSEQDRRSGVLLQVFICHFVILALLIPLVTLNLPSDVRLWSLTTLLRDGVWTTLESDWYPIIGFYITFTVLFNAVIPLLPPLFQWIVWKPCKRRCLTKATPTQMQLNKLHEGPQFDTAVKFGRALANIYTILLYFSALPLLLPVGCVLFGLDFLVEKLLLLRFYSKPPFLGPNLTSLINWLLPWAAILHVLMSIYAYSADTLQSQTVDLSLIGIPRDTIEADYLTTGFIADLPYNMGRILLQGHVFPHLAMLAIGIVFLILAQFFATPFIFVTKLFMEYLTCGLCCKRSAVDRERRYVPPYTQVFVRELNPKDEYELLSEEILDGWVLETDIRSIQRMSKVWLADGTVQGIRHKKGERKRTWEILRDESLHSYMISANPKYKYALSPKAPELTMGRSKPPPKPKRVKLDFGENSIDLV